MTREISLLVIEDHTLFRQGIRRAIETQSDITLIGEYGTVDEVASILFDTAPDVAILGLNEFNPEDKGIGRLISLFPSCRIIVLVSPHFNISAGLLLRRGASAYQRKDILPAELVRVVRDVMKGDIVIENETLPREQKLNWLLEQYRRAAAEVDSAESISTPLTERELEVLTLIVKGCSNKEVAQLLHISPQTVKNHVTAILRKLNVADRTQAVVHAVRHGWIELEAPFFDY